MSFLANVVLFAACEDYTPCWEGGGSVDMAGVEHTLNTEHMNERKNVKSL